MHKAVSMILYFHGRVLNQERGQEMIFWTGISVILHLVVMIHILRTKYMTPDCALMWLLAVVLLPFAGILCYAFFGITNIDKAHRKRLAHQSQIEHPEEHTDLSDRIAEARTFWNQFPPDAQVAEAPRTQTLDRLFPDRPAVGGNHIELLLNGTEVYPRMLEDIASAQHCIRLECFIIMNDEVGKEILNALESRAACGVEVTVLFDSVGSAKAVLAHYWRHLFQRNRKFHIRAFSPLTLFMPWKFQLRNHRKLLVIDGRIAYSGGINIAAENERLTKVPSSRYIHDLHCRITGPAVSQFALVFLRDWGYTTRRKPATFLTPYDLVEPERCGEATVRVIESGPGENLHGSMDLFTTAAAMAQKSLTILTPYFVPGSEYINNLRMAAARGVDIRIIVPDHNNHKFVDWAAQSADARLLAAGIRIFRKQGHFSHAKAFLVDQEWGMMGSSNCDSRSFKLNYELDFCFSEGKFIRDLQEQISRELAESIEVTMDDVNRKGVFRQMLESTCALMVPIL